jgi:hypothetical protein
MTSAPIPDRPDWAQAEYEQQLAMLSRLAQAGMEVVSAIEREARTVNEGGATTPEALRAFEIFPRIARAVRLTLMLKDKLIRHMLGEDRPEPKTAKSDKSDGWESVTEVHRIIIEPDHPDHPHNQAPERLRGETGERPDRERLDPDPFAVRPGEAADGVCQDIEAALEMLTTGESGTPPPQPSPPPRHRSAGGRRAPGDWGM